MQLKELPISQKPRELIKAHGPKNVSTIDLIAAILGTGTRNADVLTLASRIYSLLETESFIPSYRQLNAICGHVKACQILALLELRKRLQISQTKSSIIMDKAKNVYNHFKNYFTDSFREEFYVLYLDTKLQMTSYEKLYSGTLNAVTIHPREIFHRAMKHMAYAIILIHNHPSGDPSPSQADIEITQRISEIGTMVGIELLDHVIIGKDSFWSYAQAT